MTRESTVQKFPDGHLSFRATLSAEGLGRCLAARHWSERRRGIMAFASPARRLAAICARGVSAQHQASAVSPVGSVRALPALLSSRRRRIFRDVLRQARIPPSITARGATTDPFFPSPFAFPDPRRTHRQMSELVRRPRVARRSPRRWPSRSSGARRSRRSVEGGDGVRRSRGGRRRLHGRVSRHFRLLRRSPCDPRVSHLLPRSRRGLLRDARRGALRQPGGD